VNAYIFDVLVVGGGHAGIEASIAAARMGLCVGLVSMDQHSIGRLSCNPSVGGTAKGHLAKEIDALGGVMAILADASGIQFKMLNTSKGPAVWSPRTQNDKDLYPLFAQHLVLNQSNLTLIPEKVVEILVKNDSVVGVKTETNECISAKTVVLCSGTFLNAVMWTGQQAVSGGRVGEKAADKISDLLAAFGLTKGRLKTGTPPRIDARSIDYSVFRPHNGDEFPQPMSFRSQKVRNRLACYATQTSESTHDILRTGFSRSPMFTGLIHGTGPRYCPSIEDKIARFSDKSSHSIVLEPEGLNTHSVYVNGFSTSLPPDIQERGLQSVSGLERAQVVRYGYAVEYDFFFPYQLKFTLESKAISGLFFAGQINGTSGYEEAASQGLIAGINAALKVLERDPFTLKRTDAYIGVLIDDLVNKNTEEPYRIFTSLAEFRLLLRIDTAYDRLLPYGHKLGLISQRDYERWSRKKEIERKIDRATIADRPPIDVVNTLLQLSNESPVSEITSLAQLTRRPTVNLGDLLMLSETIPSTLLSEHPDSISKVQTNHRYQGYIEKQIRDVERTQAMEETVIPANFLYDRVFSLSTEAREKLSRIQPSTLGQASRIPGVSASDISILTVYFR
jgi:tRNA uridine 5-carboxymethylaminomethyl modification enzyme